ncbi:SCO1664 family protein [Enemella sp. A6]|uniref:SCO1664 family protein n=1 Tax=Enemella sp. A6 TaxID=3440152 RepID=UPI003EBD7750
MRHPCFDADLSGTPTIVGRLMQASNATFLVELDDDRQAIHKPVAGEKPLWDFPDATLGHRELAAHDLSVASGFDVVPRTVWIDEGPLGPGMLQAWVDTEDEDELVDLLPVAEADQPGWLKIFTGLDAHEQPVAVVHADDPRLRRLALFDVVINNADRKGGHVLLSQGTVFGVDHGLTFHVEPKLRTVLWGWAGRSFSTDEVTLLENTDRVAQECLQPWLTEAEIAATRERIADLLAAGHFPAPGRDWPTIPWPPF